MALMGGGTIYDRYRRTGYLAGRGHDYGSALEDMQPATAVEETEASGPPNLRDAGADPFSCGQCDAYDGNQHCMKFGVSVLPNQLCDGFEPLEGLAAEEG